MNVREIIREAIRDEVTIDRADIERAMSQLELAYMVAEAVEEQLPEAIEYLVKDEIDSVVGNVLGDLLS